jgi:hypothetical protein
MCRVLYVVAAISVAIKVVMRESLRLKRAVLKARGAMCRACLFICSWYIGVWVGVFSPF